MGKGSKQRPMVIDREVYDREWNRIFGYKTCEACNGQGIFEEEVVIKSENMLVGEKKTFKRACIECHGEKRVKLNSNE